MPDRLETYSIAILKYEEAVRGARRISEVINRGATALRNWEQVMVTDVQGEFPKDFEHSSRSENNLTGKEWPGAQQIADALLTFHRAKRDLEAAYEAIPGEQRNAIKPPDSVMPPR